MQLSLRNAVHGDEISIRDVVSRVLAEHGFVFEPTAFDNDLEDVVAHYHHRGGLFRVLVDENSVVVGCGGLYPLNRDEGEIRKMYFLRDARGFGFGRQLLDDLLTHARKNGFQCVRLETSSRLPGAGAHLYRQAGFVDVPHSHPSYRCDMAMVLRLGESEIHDTVETNNEYR